MGKTRPTTLLQYQSSIVRCKWSNLTLEGANLPVWKPNKELCVQRNRLYTWSDRLMKPKHSKYDFFSTPHEFVHFGPIPDRQTESYVGNEPYVSKQFANTLHSV